MSLNFIILLPIPSPSLSLLLFSLFGSFTLHDIINTPHPLPFLSTSPFFSFLRIQREMFAMSTLSNSTNIFWQECQIGKPDRQKLLNQKGCVVWITGLSGSGKSTLAFSLSRELHSRGKLSYVLDGDNLRHGLNKDLGFKPEDRAENIRRTGEVAKLFADAGLICVASLISPYRRDRDTCRAMLPDANFIEVFMNMPLELCEARDPKGLYKLARAGKIKGFTGIDDPYEPPINCEIELKQENGICPTPTLMAGKVVTYLEEKGFLEVI
ncbi:PREDICTED: adenylyl-sulfate kinase 3-like isoform X2 [Lupinus angustifolius]|uniref:adenylyl-sulfate kinase 3-like isoform X2 n=1 Tax=Lupinus angustifolius TaxID=3871 RepID=UPI00092EB7D8|nr:PREDICTED: adenylyl-sulfate kinase 3-like isoform X2 [Lupinus angustifolius]